MPEPDRAAKAYVAGTAFLALFSIVGVALYGLPLFYDFMVRDYGWSRTQVTSGNALSKLIVGPLFGFVAGWVVDRFGPRRLMLAGIVMAGGALVGLGSTSALWAFYVCYLFNALGYVCGGPLPNQVLLARWFGAARGRAMGVAYLGIGVGGMLVPLVANRLTQTYDWHWALRALGVSMVVLAFPAAYFVRESPDGAAAPAARADRPLAPVGEALRTRGFALLALASVCSIAAVGGVNQHLKLLLTLDNGYAQGDAARVVSLVLGFSVAGRLLMGWLADRFRRKDVMLLVYLLVAGSIPLLYFAASPRAMLAFAVVFGLGLGGEYLIVPLAAADLFGVRVLGRVLGVVLTSDGVAEAATPMLIGYLRDRGGSYAIGFAVLIALALAGAAAAALLPARAEGAPA